MRAGFVAWSGDGGTQCRAGHPALVERGPQRKDRRLRDRHAGVDLAAGGNAGEGAVAMAVMVRDPAVRVGGRLVGILLAMDSARAIDRRPATRALMRVHGCCREQRSGKEPKQKASEPKHSGGSVHEGPGKRQPARAALARDRQRCMDRGVVGIEEHRRSAARRRAAVLLSGDDLIVPVPHLFEHEAAIEIR